MMQPFYFAVRDFFRQALHAGAPIECVFARPDRAFAEMTRVYKKKLSSAKRGRGQKTGEGQPETAQAIEDRPFPLPFMSVWIAPLQLDKTMVNVGGRFVVSKDTAAGTAVVMRYPRAQEATVQVELWSETDLEAQQVTPQIELRFVTESVYLPIDWTDARWYRPPFDVLAHMVVLGRTRFRLAAEPGWIDSSEVEEGEGPKLTRRTWSGKLSTFVPYMPQEARLVRSINVQVYDDSDPPALLVEDAAGVED